MSPMLCFVFDVLAPATVEGISGESSGESAWPAASGESASPAEFGESASPVESGLIVESGEPSKNDNGEERSDVVIKGRIYNHLPVIIQCFLKLSVIMGENPTIYYLYL